jgi:thermostable 8-oxoguanine DNA glycosylase
MNYNDENINCIKVFIIDRHHIQNLKYSQSKVIDPVVTFSGQKYLATI